MGRYVNVSESSLFPLSKNNTEKSNTLYDKKYKDLAFMLPWLQEKTKNVKGKTKVIKKDILDGGCTLFELSVIPHTLKTSG